jgi:hypothetical protein
MWECPAIICNASPLRPIVASSADWAQHPNVSEGNMAATCAGDNSVTSNNNTSMLADVF